MQDCRSEKISRALGGAFGVQHVSVARALWLVSVCPRRNTVALLAAYPTVGQAPFCYSCFAAPHRAFGITETLIPIIFKNIYKKISLCNNKKKKEKKKRDPRKEEVKTLTWISHGGLKEIGAERERNDEKSCKTELHLFLA